MNRSSDRTGSFLGGVSTPYLLPLSLVLVEMVLPTSLLAGHPGLEPCWYTCLNCARTTGIINNPWAVMEWKVLLCLECIPRQQPQIWWLCLCHRKPLWSSRVVTPTDDVHLCIMCLRAIMNYQVSQTARTHPPELTWQPQCFMNTTFAC